VSVINHNILPKKRGIPLSELVVCRRVLLDSLTATIEFNHFANTIHTLFY